MADIGSKNTNSGKSIATAMVLVLLGVVALIGGTRWLALLIPAALLIWYGASPLPGSGRN